MVIKLGDVETAFTVISCHRKSTMLWQFGPPFLKPCRPPPQSSEEAIFTVTSEQSTGTNLLGLPKLAQPLSAGSPFAHDSPVRSIQNCYWFCSEIPQKYHTINIEIVYAAVFVIDKLTFTFWYVVYPVAFGIDT